MSLDTPARSTDAPVQEDVDAPRREPSVEDAREPRLLGGRLAVAVIGLGLLVIGLGWYGASGRGGQVDGATDVRAQLPYLLSGGFFGLSLVVLGAALLVVQASRLERARHDALLEARFEGLAVALGTTLRDPVPDGLVVAGSAAYHEAHCRLVDGRPGQDYVTVEVAEEMGLRPCRVCAT
jgi:hypothetical protein